MVEAAPVDNIDLQHFSQKWIDANKFYEWDRGNDSAILNLSHIDASMIRIEDKEILASGSPKSPEAALEFWKSLVFNNNVSLIVNLCEDVGSSEQFWNECLQYWPQTMETVIESTDEQDMKILKVTLSADN